MEKKDIIGTKQYCFEFEKKAVGRTYYDNYQWISSSDILGKSPFPWLTKHYSQIGFRTTHAEKMSWDIASSLWSLTYFIDFIAIFNLKNSITLSKTMLHDVSKIIPLNKAFYQRK